MKVTKQGGRHIVSRFLHAMNDKDMIAGWKLDFNRILVVFDVRSALFYWIAAHFSPIRPSLH